MEMDRTNVSTVAALIPAYKEAAHIGDVVKRTRTQLGNVFVVDDGSPDETAIQASEAGANVLKHSMNSGKGAAIKTGLKALYSEGFEYVVILDGDGQHSPTEIAYFLKAAEKFGTGLYVGNRMQNSKGMPLARRITNHLMSWKIGRVCGQKIPDTQCGFRMVHRDLIPLLLSATNGFDYETEMLFIVSRSGYRIISVPISTIYGCEKSKIRPVHDGIRFFKLLARYQREMRSLPYSSELPEKS